MVHETSPTQKMRKFKIIHREVQTWVRLHEKDTVLLHGCTLDDAVSLQTEGISNFKYNIPCCINLYFL